MWLNIKKCGFASLLLMSSSALASTITGDFGGVAEEAGSFNQFDVSIGGVDINVAGWSDTAETTSTSGTPNVDASDLDPFIERAVDFDKNGDGWSMTNVDEDNGASCGAGHSADNFGTNCSYQDYDFFLLTFSEKVTLTEATYSWVEGTTEQNQVSVVALDANGLATDVNGNGDLNDNTWSNINANQTLASGWAQMEYSGASGHSYYTSFSGAAAGVIDTYSKFWLIGAINEVFGGSGLEGNDGMKLAGVSFKKEPDTPNGNTPVPEPSSIVLFGLALVGLLSANRKKLS